MTEQEQPNIQLVLDFFAAWEGGQNKDLAKAYDTYLADDCIYENSGLPSFNKEETMEFFFADASDAGDIVKLVVEMHEVAASGNVVFTERTDHHYDKDGKDILTPKISGVFVVENGKFKRWADYFDPRPMLHLFEGREGREAAE